MRKACLDCARKHLAQASVLLDEAYMGYPVHVWLAIGHMAEASSELVHDYAKMAQLVRAERVRLMAEPFKYKPDFLALIEATNELEQIAKAEKASYG